MSPPPDKAPQTTPAGEHGERGRPARPTERPTERLRGWHSRGYLPHFDAGAICQALTFRLADSLPAAVLATWSAELASTPDEARARLLSTRAQRWLDNGHGNCWLGLPAIAAVVQQALLHHDAVRYRLLAWCVMPNHVHALVEPLPDVSLSDVMHSWKSYTAHQANALLDRRGRFWQPEYYDRFVRTRAHFEFAQDYIALNPVRAGLCGQPEEWSWSSAARTGTAGTRAAGTAALPTLASRGDHE